jgi:hypothetical protein
MNVLVFKTSVEEQRQVRVLTPVLNRHAGRGNWNFALDDRDRVLRIKSSCADATFYSTLLQQHGFFCRELTD